MVPSLRGSPLPRAERGGTVGDREVMEAGQRPQDGQPQKAWWAGAGGTKLVLWSNQELVGCSGVRCVPSRAWAMGDMQGAAQGSPGSSASCHAGRVGQVVSFSH